LYIDPLADTINELSGEAEPLCLIWADDLLIQPYPGTKPSEIQAIINRIGIFSKENNQKPGIKKCGIIIPSNTTQEDIEELHHISLCDDLIPVVKSYVYLGVEFTEHGINLRMFFDRNLKKAKNVLLRLQDIGSHWTIFERLVMFKAFSLSCVMYAAPLLYLQYLASQKSDVFTVLINDINDLITLACQWILSSERITIAERGLLGLIPTEHLLRNSALILKDQLRRVGDSVPAGKAFLESKNNAYALISQSLIARLHQVKHPELDNDALPKSELLRLNISWATKCCKLSSYCPKQARTQGGCCIEFKQRSPNSQRYARWRLNRPLDVECPQCKETAFNREHFKCLTELYGERPPMTFRLSDKDKNAINRNMTALDIALNKGDYEFFDNAVEGKGWIATKKVNSGNSNQHDHTKLDVNDTSNDNAVVTEVLNQADQEAATFLRDILDEPLTQTALDLLNLSSEQ
jgi:hypothetical protein